MRLGQFGCSSQPRSGQSEGNALLSERGKRMYSGHIENFAGVDGLTLRYLQDGESGTF